MMETIAELLTAHVEVLTLSSVMHTIDSILNLCLQRFARSYRTVS